MVRGAIMCYESMAGQHVNIWDCIGSTGMG